MTATAAPAPTQQNETLASLLRQPAYANRFKDVLGDRAGEFVSSVLSVGATMKDVEPNSIIAAAMIAASLRLPINRNLGFAWIVPYLQQGRRLAQFQMGYKGFIQLALRTGQYSRMNVRSVNAEAFGGFDDVGEPVILWDKIDEAKEPVGYAFAWKLVSGFAKVCYWSREKVEAHAERYSQAYRKGGETPWRTHFDQMAKKTVVKNELSHWGILSVEFQRAFEADQAIYDGEAVYIDNEEKPKAAPKAKPPLENRAKAQPGDGDDGPDIEAEAEQGLAPAPSSEAKDASQPQPQPPLPNEGPNKKGPAEAPDPPAEQPGPVPEAAPAPALQAEPPAQDGKPDQVITHELQRAGVAFDEFTDWLQNSGRYKDAKTMKAVSDLPADKAAEILALDPKGKRPLDRCLKMFGTNAET